MERMKWVICILGIIAMIRVPSASATLVTFSLKESDGATGISGAEVYYYKNGWRSLGQTNSNGLANLDVADNITNLTMRVRYGGSLINLTQNITETPLFSIQTVGTEVNLNSSLGHGLSRGTVEYYANGWRKLGVTNEFGVAARELLPGTYKFRMKYEGGINEFTQDIGANSTVTFNTNLNVINLTTAEGEGLAGGKAYYYANGWRSFDVTDEKGVASKELLPGTYATRLTYNYQTNLVGELTGETPINVITGSVCFDYNGRIQYYANGWHTFTNNMEMLPGDYNFRFGNETRMVTIIANSVPEPASLIMILAGTSFLIRRRSCRKT